MHNTESIEKKIEEATSLGVKYLREGWGSRSSVFLAICDLFAKDVSQEICINICYALDPFHGVASAIYEDGKAYGITVCGALSGGLASFSLINGFKDLPFNFWTEGMKSNGFLGKIIDNPEVSPKEKIQLYYEKCEPLYGAYYQMVYRFKEHFGTTDCLDFEKPFADPISTKCFRNCAKIIAWTSGMVARMLIEYKEDPEKFKVGHGNVHLEVMRSVKASKQGA